MGVARAVATTCSGGGGVGAEVVGDLVDGGLSRELMMVLGVDAHVDDDERRRGRGRPIRGGRGLWRVGGLCRCRCLLRGGRCRGRVL